MSDLRRLYSVLNREGVRYIINGLVATAVHFVILWALLNVAGLESAGVANFIAAIFGILTSFLGSRYFVFRGHTQSIFHQASKFLGLYGGIAVLHGLTLFLLTDQMGVDYRLAFLVATGLQVMMGYLGNKFMVFSK